MGNAETLPLSQAKQDIGYVAIVLRRKNKVRIIYDTPQIKSVLDEIVREIVRYVILEFVKERFVKSPKNFFLFADIPHIPYFLK